MAILPLAEIDAGRGTRACELHDLLLVFSKVWPDMLSAKQRILYMIDHENHELACAGKSNGLIPSSAAVFEVMWFGRARD